MGIMYLKYVIFLNVNDVLPILDTVVKENYTT